MAKVIDIYNFLNSLAPFDTQEKWDNSGLLAGSGRKQVKRAYICLDCTAQAAEKAAELSCELIISHHPIIFTPLKTLPGNSPAYLAAKNDISVISTHTCYDFAPDGVSDILADALGLKNIRKSPTGEYTLGDTEKTTVSAFAKKVKEKLNARVSFCNGGIEVETVAVCGGAGFDFAFDAKENGADAFVTGECGYHEFLDAAGENIGLITAGHFETEVIAMGPLKVKLEKEFPEICFILAEESSVIKYI